MNGRTFARGTIRVAFLLGIAGVLAACATTRPVQQQMSILDALDMQRSSLGPSSCAAMNITSVCEKSTRLDSGRNCGCADPRALADGKTFRF